MTGLFWHALAVTVAALVFIYVFSLTYLVLAWIDEEWLQ